jgi:hypothetical protein
MKACRQCGQSISEDAVACPHCGAPFPAKEKWDGWGWEYKSEASMFGLPILHISFKYRPNRVPVVAKGIVAIGQFGCGVFTIAQFGVGVVTVSQFAAGFFALAQIGIAYDLIAQIGLYVNRGYGMVVHSLSSLLGVRF